VHAKDVAVDPFNGALNGVLDTKPFGDATARSWIFRTVGYGHGHEVWKNMISALRLVGYDDVLSIEHEDLLMSPREGLTKAVSFMKDVILAEKREKTMLFQ
jgi:sugar phosphate isomerase/epimerase